MNPPIRILHVLGIMNRGGAESFVMNLYRTIDRTKVQFDFVVHTNEEGAFDHEITSLGGHIYRVPKFNVKNIFTYQKAWDDLLKMLPHKIIHCHIRSTASIILKQAKKNNYITIAHSHSTSSGSGIQGMVKNALQSKINKYADYRFACGKEAGEWLFKGADFTVLENGIDLEKYLFNQSVRKMMRTELQVDQSFVIGHVARFSEVKNHKFLIDIFSSIKKKNNKAKLLLIGTGDLEDSIKEKVKSLDLESSVLFLGARDDVNHLLQAMDCFVFPSLFEGLPVSLVEAQTASLSVFASNTISAEAKLTNLVHFMSLNDSPDEWAKVILTEALPEDKRKMIEVKSEIQSEGYDIIQTTNKLTDFYLCLS